MTSKSSKRITRTVSSSELVRKPSLVDGGASLTAGTGVKEGPDRGAVRRRCQSGDSAGQPAGIQPLLHAGKRIAHATERRGVHLALRGQLLELLARGAELRLDRRDHCPDSLARDTEQACAFLRELRVREHRRGDARPCAYFPREHAIAGAGHQPEHLFAQLRRQQFVAQGPMPQVIAKHGIAAAERPQSFAPPEQRPTAEAFERCAQQPPVFARGTAARSRGRAAAARPVEIDLEEA